jgi:hypothetical protein
MHKWEDHKRLHVSVKHQQQQPLSSLMHFAMLTCGLSDVVCQHMGDVK